MKNRRIHFDDRFYWTIFSFVVSICSLILLIVCVEKLPIWGYIGLATTFLLFLTGIYIFPKMGIFFHYKSERSKYLGPHKIKRSVIKMDEVEKIDFKEIYAPKKKGMTPKDYVAYANEVNYVYRNGKIYMFHVFLKNGEIIEIPYFNLFKAFSKRRVKRQEKYIREVLEEFNASIR